MLILKATLCVSALPRICTTCKVKDLTRVDDELTADIKAVSQRIAALIQFELEPSDERLDSKAVETLITAE